MPLRVLIASDGLSIHAQRALGWHLARGCEVAFLSAHDPRPEGGPGYRFLRLPCPRGGSLLRPLVGQRVIDRWVERARVAWVRRQLHRFRPDVVHVYQVDQLADYVARAGARPLVLSAWGSDINHHFERGADPLGRQRTAETLRAAAMILADSADVLDKCKELSGPDVPTALLMLGIDTARFRPGYQAEVRQWRQRLQIPTGARVILSARSILPRYLPEQVLEAYRQALPRFGVPTVLLFKPYYHSPNSAVSENALRERIAELGLEGQVRWVRGVPHERLPEVYALADVIVSFPMADGFPVCFLEAAACERPVIASRLASYRGTFAEEYFRLVEPGNIEALSEAMVEAVRAPSDDNADARSELRRRVQAEYDESVTVARLFAIYEQLRAVRCSSVGASRSLVAAAGG